MSAFYVTIRSRGILADVAGFRERVVAKLVSVIKMLSIDVQRAVKEDKLSGQVLNVRTGTLRRSINREVRLEPSRLWAVIGTNVHYAAVQEYGGHIPEVTGKLMVFPVPGLSPEFLKATGQLKRRYKTKQYRDMSVFTMRHRAFDLPPRSFLRSTLKEWEPEITKRFSEAVGEAIAESGGAMRESE